MTSPTAFSGRPLAPAPGAAAPELRVATLRPQARRLLWSALVLIAVSGAVMYFTGNMPAPFTDVMLWAAAGAIVVLLVVLPWVLWLSHTYTITTRRVIEKSGLVRRRTTELTHAHGYTITEKRGIVQRLWGTGDLILTHSDVSSIRLRNIPAVRLVHETLVDQVEVGQILAHRDAQVTTEFSDTSPLA